MTPAALKRFLQTPGLVAVPNTRVVNDTKVPCAAKPACLSHAVRSGYRPASVPVSNVGPSRNTWKTAQDLLMPRAFHRRALGFTAQEPEAGLVPSKPALSPTTSYTGVPCEYPIHKRVACT